MINSIVILSFFSMLGFFSAAVLLVVRSRRVRMVADVKALYFLH